MTTLDRGRSINPDDALKEIMGVIREFYKDDNIEQKTELNDILIDNMGKTQYKQKMQKDRFGVDIDYNETVIIPKMQKLVSRKRTGRTEAMQVLQAQLAQIMAHPAQGIRRALGLGE
jgi:hypothetical protein